MKQKHIDASREVRLWIGQICLPAIGIAILLYPEIGNRIRNAQVKRDIENFFSR